jgi:opacity protein-like surface antigen
VTLILWYYTITKKQGLDMKKITLSALAVVALTSFGYAGGDITPVIEPVIVEESTSSFYVGAGLAALSARGSDVSLNFFSEESGQDRMGNFTLLAGYNFNEYIAVEGRYTGDINNADVVDMSGWSLFVKPQYPVSEDFSVYALLGFGGVKLDPTSGSSVNINVDDTGFQWGLGISYDVLENLEIFADYTNLANNMEGVYRDNLAEADLFEADTDALTIGVNYKF